MQRPQSEPLRGWLGRSTRKPLVIRGARQVGKSTLVDLFAAQSGRDLVADFSGHIVPIDVKAGRTGTLKSLHQFVAEKRVPMAIRFHAEQPERQSIVAQAGGKAGGQPVRYELLSLPLYLVERLPHCVQALAWRL